MEDDQELLLSMLSEFYQSDAVAHTVDAGNFETTFNAAMDHSPFIRILVIERDQIPVGYALLSFTYSNEMGGIVVLIEELYIRKNHQGKGYAREFFAFLEQEYSGAKRFRLEVREDNTNATDLYRKLGYTTLGYLQMVKDQ